MKGLESGDLVTLKEEISVKYGWLCWCGKGRAAVHATVEEAFHAWEEHYRERHHETEHELRWRGGAS